MVQKHEYYFGGRVTGIKSLWSQIRYISEFFSSHSYCYDVIIGVTLINPLGIEQSDYNLRAHRFRGTMSFFNHQLWRHNSLKCSYVCEMWSLPSSLHGTRGFPFFPNKQPFSVPNWARVTHLPRPRHVISSLVQTTRPTWKIGQRSSRSNLRYNPKHRTNLFHLYCHINKAEQYTGAPFGFMSETFDSARAGCYHIIRIAVNCISLLSFSAI